MRDKIEKRLSELGLKKSELATKIGLKSPSQLSVWLAGDVMPGPAYRQAIADCEPIKAIRNRRHAPVSSRPSQGGFFVPYTCCKKCCKNLFAADEHWGGRPFYSIENHSL